MNGHAETLRGHGAMLVFSGLVAGSFSLGGLVANDVAPIALMAARFWLAALFIVVIAVATGGMKRQDFRAPWRYFVLGSIFAVYFVLMFEGLKTAPPVSAAAVFTLVPTMAAVFGWLVLRQITTRAIALALAVGAVGAIWVIFRADLSAMLAFRIGRGEAIYFIGCIAHALYVPLLRALNRGEGPLASTLGVLVAGGAMMTLVGWPEIGAVDWAGLRPLVWWALAYLVVFATAVTFMLVQYASMRLPASNVMAYSYLTPSWVILWELALGHTAPPALVLAGIGLTLVAVGLLLRHDRRGFAPARKGA